MSETHNTPPAPLSLDEFTATRLAVLGLMTARESYGVEISMGVSPQPNTMVALHQAASEVPYDRLCATDRAIASTIKELDSGAVSDHTERPAIVDTLSRDLAEYLWDQQGITGRLEFLHDVYGDLVSIYGDACQAWPLPIARKKTESVVVKPAPASIPAPLPEQKADDMNDYEQLAAAIPPIFPLLMRAKSEHVTAHRVIKSAADTLQDRRQLPFTSSERKASDQLAQRIIFLERNFLADPEDKTYRTYYTPAEIISLTDKLLEALEQRDNPAYLNDLLRHAKPIAEVKPYYAERSEDYFYERPEEVIELYTMTEERERPPTVVWEDQADEPDPFEITAETARAASENIRQYMLAGLVGNTHRKHYLLQVKDIDGDNAWPGMSDLYQFICDDHALEVLGSLRQTKAQSAFRKVGPENAQIIRTWQQENKALLASIPNNFMLTLKPKMNVSQFERIAETLPAKEVLRRRIHVMNARLDGSETRGILRSFQDSPAAFYRLQLGIAKTVEEIKEQLPHFDGGLSVKPIEPLI